MKESRATHLFIDFDETLFEHLAFQAYSANMLNQLYDIDPQRYLENFDPYHEVQQGMHRLYQHEDHLRDTTGLEWDTYSGQLTESVRRDEAAHFCYDDAHEFVEEASKSGMSVRLLTYGIEAYQRFKISLCPVIGRLPVHIVCEPKGDFLSRHFSDASIKGILVDDKIPIPLPDNWQHIWLNRNERERPQDHTPIEITRLHFPSLADTIALS